MTPGTIPDGLKLTEEEAFALLGLCLTSPNRLDAVSEKALRKLAEYCTSSHTSSEGYLNLKASSYHLKRELGKAGA
jgi:hypothetical protein